MIDRFLPYIIPFVGALVLTLILTPIVREINRKFGLVDKPDGRRINKKPIPRGGGVAVYFGVVVSYSIFILISGLQPLGSVPAATFWKLIACTGFITVVGFVDDKFSLPPKIKLLCQVIVSFLIWKWAGLGFSDLWPSLHPVFDCIITVFWITGAMNAFNLIDGLDGLASGLAIIAVVGMGGGLFFSGCTAQISFYAAFVGGLLGFLRYNYNPASVFLGDSGSMMIGCLVSVLPLCSHVENSFLVSVGVPLLAMGVPIFDTSLAIFRRSIRRILRKADGGNTAEGQVMTADTDHLHHRVLRSMGLSQSRAAWVLYLVAAFAVAVGLVATYMRSRTTGLWLAAFSIATVIIFRDMARVELFDIGVLLDRVVHSHEKAKRRLAVRLAVPLLLLLDVAFLALSFLVVASALGLPFNEKLAKVVMPIFVTATFSSLVVARTYLIVWSRAMPLDYARLSLACVVGSLISSVSVYYIYASFENVVFYFAFFFAALSFLGLIFARFVRILMRNFFYQLDCSRLVGRKDVSRVLVYGAGLRFRAFRRELVRHASQNSRIIVGILDDDYLLKGRIIGGLRVFGTIRELPELINRYNIDSIVITCDISDEKLAVIKNSIDSSQVTLKRFMLSEETIVAGPEKQKGTVR
ncbi:MAG: hypothetical protein J6R63_04190 [Kiritimatiellae bacterium]|nr:hypothetical protein [Kiritimatiellia bacterium]